MYGILEISIPARVWGGKIVDFILWGVKFFIPFEISEGGSFWCGPVRFSLIPPMAGRKRIFCEAKTWVSLKGKPFTPC